MASPVLVIPGFGGSGPAHWQSRWEQAEPAFSRVGQADWDHPILSEWVANLEAAVRAAGPDVVLVAHSLGCLTVAHWAAGEHSPVRGALLVAVPDPAGASFPAQAEGFGALPAQPLPFLSVVVASSDDPYGGLDFARRWARLWGSRLEEIGPAGHINADSGLGDWAAGRAWLDGLRRPPVSPAQLLFLPGAGGDPAFWSPAARLLRHPGRQDLLGWPGFGVVPADPRVRGIDDLVDRVVGMLDRPSALIAQSMGGVVALRAALERPEQITHLVLTATSGGVDMEDLQAQDWRPAFRRARPDLPTWFVDCHDDLSLCLPDTKLPTLLLWGDRDPISPIAVGKRLQSLLPQSTMHVLPGGDHDLAVTHAAAVAALIDAHLGMPGAELPVGTD